MQTEQERKAFGIMKKKTVLWILSMAVCGSLLTGCGTAEKKESETIAATETKVPGTVSCHGTGKRYGKNLFQTTD